MTFVIEDISLDTVPTTKEKSLFGRDSHFQVL